MTRYAIGFRLFEFLRIFVYIFCYELKGCQIPVKDVFFSFTLGIYIPSRWSEVFFDSAFASRYVNLWTLFKAYVIPSCLALFLQTFH